MYTFSAATGVVIVFSFLLIITLHKIEILQNLLSEKAISIGISQNLKLDLTSIKYSEIRLMHFFFRIDNQKIPDYNNVCVCGLLTNQFCFLYISVWRWLLGGISYKILNRIKDKL